VPHSRFVRRVLIEVAAVLHLLRKLVAHAAATARNLAGRLRERFGRSEAEPEPPPPATELPHGWASWAAEWRRWAIRTLKLALLGGYLFCLWCFFSIGGTESPARVRGDADYVHTIGSPEPWFVVENQRPAGLNCKLRLLSPAWLSLAVGVLSYYVYWRIRRAELGRRGRIRLIAGPIAHAAFWLVIGFAAIVTGMSAEAHENIMRLPLGLSIF
jgi:hypothetical protein